MGSPDGEAGRSNDEGPQTEVTISRGFWLGIYAVTQEEWRAVAEEVSGINAEPSYFRGDRLPVEQVSWNDCQQWLQELNTLEGRRLPHGFQYRLPTEAEWEFVCRAGTSTRFHCGNGDSQVDDTPGILGTAGVKRMWWGKRRRMRGGFTTCTGMFGNGAGIGMVRCLAGV